MYMYVQLCPLVSVYIVSIATAYLNDKSHMRIKLRKTNYVHTSYNSKT